MTEATHLANLLMAFGFGLIAVRMVQAYPWYVFRFGEVMRWVTPGMVLLYAGIAMSRVLALAGVAPSPWLALAALFVLGLLACALGYATPHANAAIERYLVAADRARNHLGFLGRDTRRSLFIVDTSEGTAVYAFMDGALLAEFGTRGEDLVGQPLLPTVPERWRAQVESFIYSTEREYSYELTYPDKYGNERELVAYFWRDPDDLATVYGETRDVTPLDVLAGYRVENRLQRHLPHRTMTGGAK